MGTAHARAATVAQVAAGAAVLAFAAHTVLPDRGAVAWAFDYLVYYGIVVAAMVLAVLRPLLVRDQRAGWAAMAVAVLCFGGGELTWLAFVGTDPDPPYPSIADALYLSFYPAAYVGIVLLFRSRFTGITPGLWIDGLAAALAAATLGSAIVVEAVLDATEGSTSTVVTNLAYPAGDVILLSLVVAVFLVTACRPGWSWALLGAALAVSAIGDGVYLFQSAAGTYVEGALVDATWPAALVLLASAAWRDRPVRRRIDVGGRPLLAVPAACAAVAAYVLVYDHFVRVNVAAIVLSTLVLGAVLVRLGLAFRDNARLLEQSRQEAVTDQLTGLGNRRRLLADLDARLAVATPERPWLLALFDLDGFKVYNDAFGHPAGDALLARLGGRLASVPGERGLAYRLGGDEFCVLVRADGVDDAKVLEDALDALADRGEAFEVTSSVGAVSLPDDATEPDEALRLADERLYAMKHDRRAQRDRLHLLLLAMLQEREPDLHDHLEGVAALASQVGARLGLRGEELTELERAAQLHDIGKISIPDAILHKPEALDDAEWDFVRQHTVVGERILSASPALRAAAAVVRSSHERWDGAGYPDGLAGEEIPLASRIIFACDAFDAITSPRPYHVASSPEEALAELERCAGTQFDPRVVASLADVVRGRSRRAAA